MIQNFNICQILVTTFFVLATGIVADLTALLLGSFVKDLGV